MCIRDRSSGFLLRAEVAHARLRHLLHQQTCPFVAVLPSLLLSHSISHHGCVWFNYLTRKWRKRDTCSRIECLSPFRWHCRLRQATMISEFQFRASLRRPSPIVARFSGKARYHVTSRVTTILREIVQSRSMPCVRTLS